MICKLSRVVWEYTDMFMGSVKVYVYIIIYNVGVHEYNIMYDTHIYYNVWCGSVRIHYDV